MTVAGLAGMPVAEVFDRLTAGRRAEAEARTFAVHAASFAYRKPDDQREVLRGIDRLARSEVKRLGVLETLPDARRIERIGFMLGKHGQPWADKHKREMAWLASAGVTPDEAIRRHADWYRREVAEDRGFAAERRARSEAALNRLRRVVP